MLCYNNTLCFSLQFIVCAEAHKSDGAAVGGPAPRRKTSRHAIAERQQSTIGDAVRAAAVTPASTVHCPVHGFMHTLLYITSRGLPLAQYRPSILK